MSIAVNYPQKRAPVVIKRPETGPKGWPVLGVLPKLKQDPPQFLLNCAREYGPVVPMKLGPHRVILAAHPAAVEHILRDNASNYVKTRFAEKLKPLLGNGVATSNGAAWTASRNIIHPMLKPAEIDRLLADMDEVIRANCDAWSGQSTLDMSQRSCALTLRIIARTMFGTETAESADRVVAAIDEVQARLSDRIWSINPLSPYLPSKENRRFKRAIDDVLGVVEGLIKDRRARPRGGDMLAALLDACQPDTGAPFSDAQIRDEIMTIFMAGHETTGNTLAWLWEILARHPDIQQRVREEVLAFVPFDRSPTLNDLRRLTYTQAVLQETMRLKPSAWWFARTAVNDDEVMGCRLRRGDSVIISQYVTHRLEEFWPHPEQFDPQRFIERKPSHRFAFIPFGGGPRTCPGGHFAMAEMSLVLARALARFAFKPVEEDRPRRYEALVTLRPKDGMPLRLEPFRQALWIKNRAAGTHALLDAALRVRKAVFIDKLGWPLSADGEGREIDQFDTGAAIYLVLVAEGQIAACARALPANEPTLLYDVFAHLIEDPEARTPAPDIWEGARLAVTPGINGRDCRLWCKELLYQSVVRARLEGIRRIHTVSDPVMERVLQRAGANPRRIGPVVRDAAGFDAVALRIDCTSDIVDRLKSTRTGFLSLDSTLVAT